MFILSICSESNNSKEKKCSDLIGRFERTDCFFLSLQSSPAPALPNLSRCAACYNHKKNFLYGGDGESSSSAGDSGPEVDWDSEAESLSSSSSSSVEEDEEQEERSSPEGEGEDEEREDEGRKPEEGTSQTHSQDTPASSDLQPRPTSRPHTMVSTLHLWVLPQEHAGDAVSIIQLHEEQTEERDGERGVDPPPPQTGWSHAPSQQHQLSYPQQQHLHAYQMFPQHSPPFPAQGQRSPLTLHSPPVPAYHGWPQPPYADPTHLGTQVPHQCWCCYNRVLPPFGYQNKNING